MIYYQHHFELSWDYGEARDFKVTSFYSCDTSTSTFRVVTRANCFQKTGGHSEKEPPK